MLHSNLLVKTKIDAIVAGRASDLKYPGRIVMKMWTLFYFIFLVSYVGERPWWPIQSLNKGRKKKAKG